MALTAGKPHLCQPASRFVPWISPRSRSMDVTGTRWTIPGPLSPLDAVPWTVEPSVAGSSIGVWRRSTSIRTQMSPLVEAAIAHASDSFTLTEMAEDAYFLLARYLDATSLCGVDAACHALRAWNSARGGPWQALGVSAFNGMELERVGVFELAEIADEACLDWKGRYRHFKTELPTFCAPFSGSDITCVRHCDEVAYCRCRLRTDRLELKPACGVYVEVEVLANPDNVSLAVCDDGGLSTVTFSPDTGAVIREYNISDGRTSGAFLTALLMMPLGHRFHGLVGVYLRDGHLAFFRRHVAVEGDGEGGPWECTGFVTDLAWVESCRLTPCLAFRDKGHYRARLARVGSAPPLPPDRMPWAYEEASWVSCDWEAGPPQA